MDLALLVQNMLLIILPIGLPIVILLVLAVQIDKWHRAQDEPPDEAFRHESH